jgi:hypothetical protein
MEDVNISKFRAQVVRAGSTPASPGFVVSEGQNPVDPSGSGQNHLPVTIATASTGLSITDAQVLGGAGTVGQYIRGDGSLADFPATTGGGSSVSYYLNGSVSQGTIGGVAYKELNKTPIFGAGTDISINADGYIASFITDAGDPNKLLIPAGNWNFETYFSASSNGGSPSFYIELYKYNGTTFTLIASSSSAPELIAFGTNLNPYFSALAVPETVLALTDRLALRYYVTHSGRTITLHTENNHLCQVITTFTSGLTALNGLTSQVQYLTVGTSGTDFAISSVTDTHTFNLPTASATNRGALSSADWTTFNNKTSNLGTVTSVGLSSATSGVTIGSTPITTSGTITLAIATASGSQNGLLSSTDWTTFNGKQNALTNPVTGTGTTNYLPKFTGASTIGNSIIQEGTYSIGFGITPNTTNSSYKLFQFSSGASLTSTASGIGSFYLSNNAYLNVSATSWVRINTGFASDYYQENGQHAWRTIGSGSAGSEFVYSQPMTLTSGGNLLVGTPTDQGQRLLVQGTGGTTGFTRFTDGATAAMFIGVNSGTPFIHSNNSTLSFGATGANTFAPTMTLSSGNVGIGTTSPLSILSIRPSTSSSGPSTIEFTDSDNAVISSYFNMTIAVDNSNTVGGRRIVFAKGAKGYGNQVTSMMTIVADTSNVLIGTTTDTGAKLNISGSSSSYPVSIEADSGGNQLALTRSGAFSQIFMGGTTGATTELNIRSGGSGGVYLASGGIAWLAASDERLKTDLVDIENGLEKVSSLRSVIGRYLSDSEDKKRSFLIAQDVEKVLPEAVVTNESTGYMGLSYTEVIPLLVAAIKELKQEIDILKN